MLQDQQDLPDLKDNLVMLSLAPLVSPDPQEPPVIIAVQLLYVD